MSHPDHRRHQLGRPAPCVQHRAALPGRHAAQGGGDGVLPGPGGLLGLHRTVPLHQLHHVRPATGACVLRGMGCGPHTHTHTHTTSSPLTCACLASLPRGMIGGYLHICMPLLQLNAMSWVQILTQPAPCYGDFSILQNMNMYKYSPYYHVAITIIIIIIIM